MCIMCECNKEKCVYVPTTNKENIQSDKMRLFICFHNVYT